MKREEGPDFQRCWAAYREDVLNSQKWGHLLIVTPLAVIQSAATSEFEFLQFYSPFYSLHRMKPNSPRLLSCVVG